MMGAQGGCKPAGAMAWRWGCGVVMGAQGGCGAVDGVVMGAQGGCGAADGVVMGRWMAWSWERKAAASSLYVARFAVKWVL